MSSFSGTGGSIPPWMMEKIKKNVKKAGKKLKKIASKELPKKIKDELKATELLNEIERLEEKSDDVDGIE